jgi:hypothetical protein
MAKDGDVPFAGDRLHGIHVERSAACVQFARVDLARLRRKHDLIACNAVISAAVPLEVASDYWPSMRRVHRLETCHHRPRGRARNCNSRTRRGRTE